MELIKWILSELEEVTIMWRLNAKRTVFTIMRKMLYSLSKPFMCSLIHFPNLPCISTLSTGTIKYQAYWENQMIAVLEELRSSSGKV